MATDLRFLPTIPDGMRIFAADVEVAGVKYRLTNALTFAKGRGHVLELERDRNNEHDPNAIKVIGISKGWFFRRRRFIGFVPADTAASIAALNYWGVIRPRLKNIWVGDNGYVIVRLDILGPKQKKKRR